MVSVNNYTSIGTSLNDFNTVNGFLSKMLIKYYDKDTLNVVGDMLPIRDIQYSQS